jgi:hypothetical protein
MQASGGPVSWNSRTVALLDNADEAGQEALRRQIKQQLKLLVSKIMVHVEGKPPTKNKKVDCSIHLKNGVERRIWFQTGKKAVADGLWTADGAFPMEDMDAFTVMALESLDPAELPGVPPSFWRSGGVGKAPRTARSMSRSRHWSNEAEGATSSRQARHLRTAPEPGGFFSSNRP